MTSYDPNAYSGFHRLKLTLQLWEYTGVAYVTLPNDSRHGLAILESIHSGMELVGLLKNSHNNIKFKTDFDDNNNLEWHFILTDKEGDKLPVSGSIAIDESFQELADLIVGIDIVDFSEYNDFHRSK